MPKTSEDHSFPRLIVVNQAYSPAFQQLINRLSQSIGTCRILGGSTFPVERNGNLEVISGPKYIRKGFIWRSLSWIFFSLWASIKLLFVRRNEFVLVVSNPPLMIPIVYLLSRLKNFRYGLLVWDVYPDHLVKSGMIKCDGLVHRYWVKMSGKSIEGADFVITLSQGMLNSLGRHCSMKNNLGDKFSIIPNWADTDTLFPLQKNHNPFMKKLRLENKTIFLYSGNIGLTHDLLEVLQAAKKFNDNNNVAFVFIGDGLGFEVIRDFAKKEVVKNIHFLPRQPWKMLPYSLACGDVAIVIQSPGTEHLSIPSKTYSSLAVGSAILAITESSSDLSQLVKKHHLGFVSNNKSLNISEKMSSFLSNSNELNTMKENSRKVAEEYFSEDVVYNSFQKLFKEKDL
jgi:glycosyltransferase involved in cell wall biosynthesis